MPDWQAWDQSGTHPLSSRPARFSDGATSSEPSAGVPDPASGDSSVDPDSDREAGQADEPEPESGLAPEVELGAAGGPPGSLAELGAEPADEGEDVSAISAEADVGPGLALQLDPGSEPTGPRFSSG